MYFDIQLVVFSFYFLASTILAVVNAKCDSPPAIENGFVKTSDTKDSYEKGEKVKYECDIGHRLDVSSGRATSECLENGEWASPAFSCLPVQCPQLENPQHGRIVGTEVTFGKSVTFECFSGYERWTRYNNMERVCMEDGQWNGEQFECRPVKCPDLKDIENGKISQKTGVYKTEVEYSCLSNFRLSGEKIRKCLQTGSWSSNEPECISHTIGGSCPSPLSSAFLEQFKHLAKTDVPVGIKPGHRVTFICASDANLKIVSTCSRLSEWSPPPPSDSYCSVPTSAAPATTTSTATEITQVSTTVAPGSAKSTTESNVLQEDSAIDPVEGEESATDNPDKGDGDKTESPTEPTSLPIWVFIVIPVALITLVSVLVTAFFIKKKNRQNGKLGDKDKTDAEMESLANNKAHL